MAPKIQGSPGNMGVLTGIAITEDCSDHDICEYANMQICKYANMGVCSDLLIGRSASQQIVMCGARGYDSIHGEVTNRGKFVVFVILLFIFTLTPAPIRSHISALISAYSCTCRCKNIYERMTKAKSACKHLPRTFCLAVQAMASTLLPLGLAAGIEDGLSPSRG